MLFENYAIAPHICDTYYVWTYQTMCLPGADDVEVNEIRLYKFFLNFESVHFAFML